MKNKPLEKVGDRVICTFFNDSVNNSDPKTRVLEPKKGDTGTIVKVKHIKNFANYGEGYWQIWIKWDSHGKEFPLIWGMDGFERLRYDGGWFCCFCKKPIADQQVPDEVKKKISLQMVWHKECA